MISSFFFHFRMPEMILLDQGGEFQNNFSMHLSQLYGVEQLRTISPINPKLMDKPNVRIPSYA